MENNILEYASAQREAAEHLANRKMLATQIMGQAMKSIDPTELVAAFVVTMEALDKATAWVCYHEALCQHFIDLANSKTQGANGTTSN